ncbi:MAG TPA: hypothetical protein VF658_21635 [Pyrinomonadaceae bacterium]
MQIFSLLRSVRSSSRLLACLTLLVCSAVAVSAQQKEQKSTAATALTDAVLPKLTRTTTRHELRQLPYGSTITLLGAPAGSITIEAWPRTEIDITADIELRADTEEDLTRLAALNTFLVDEEPNHLRIITTGTHDKKFMRRAAKDFPKKLLGLPWKIDYHLRVPVMSDLEINAGRGTFNLTGVEGSISFQSPESEALLAPTGGALSVTLLRGSIKLIVPTRSWRGSGANLQLAAGDLTLELPAGFNGDIDAAILRTGQIENTYAELAPREHTTTTPRSTKLRAGAGGATLALTVGDGTIRIKRQ